MPCHCLKIYVAVAMAAASSTAYSQFSTAKMLHGVQISTAMVQEKQHEIFCFLIKLIFPRVECHTYFESLGTVNHQNQGFFLLMLQK